MITLKKKFSDSFNFLYNKKALVRVDLNVPMKNGEVDDNTRLTRIIPTLQTLFEKKAKVILISHFGRPDGKWDTQYSLKNICNELSILLKDEIKFVDKNIHNISNTELEDLFNDYNFILLENIRFYPEEKKCDDKFIKKLCSLGDLFINECFSGCHRDHASISGLPKYLPSFPGKLLEDEIVNLKNLILSSESAQNLAILGGAKISTKLKIIEFYANNYSKVLIGGAMANTFLTAAGIEIGESLYEKRMLKTAEEILDTFPVKIVLPSDVVVTVKKDPTRTFIKKISDVEKNDLIMDIGPQTRMIFYNEILESDNLLWNGPLGFFEKKPFDAGTNYVLNAVKNNKNKKFFSVAGGGDTISMIRKANTYDSFSFISTGGGAFLEFIQRGNFLPGLSSLNN